MSANDLVNRKTRTRWYLTTNALYAGSSPSINWKTLIPEGRGNKHQRTYLIRSSKELLTALMKLPRQATQEKLSHATILNMFRDIRALVRWMTERGAWRFSALTGDDIVQYMAHCKIRQRVGGGENSPFTVYRKFKIFSEMWLCKRYYLAALRVNPSIFPFDEPIRPRTRLSTWGHLDESDALSLIGDAIEWVDVHGPYITSVYHRLWKLDASAVGQNTRNKYIKRSIFYESISNEPGMLRLKEHLNCHDDPVHLTFKRAKYLCDGACITLLLFLEGIRARELARLDAGCLQFGQDGMCRIKGIAAKRNGMERTWVVCDAVIKAVSHLEECYRPARSQGKNKALIITGSSSVLLRPGFKSYRISYTAIREKLKYFASSEHRATRLRAKLHPHVARKTFARFVVMRDKSALESLAYHFGHVTTAITDGHYVGNDIELAKMLTEESRKDLVAGLMDLLTSQQLGGAAGKALTRARSEVGARFRGKKALHTLVEKLIAEGVQLAPCNWGYCVYSPALSACHGTAAGPSLARRSADVCSTCQNFATTERHRAWWELRLRQQDDFLTRDGLPAQTVAIVETRRRNAAKVLANMNTESSRLISETGGTSAEGSAKRRDARSGGTPAKK